MNRWSQLYAPLIGRILIGGFFLWNGIQQILNFSLTIHTFQSIPVAHASTWALIVVWIEIFGGLGLIVGFKTRVIALLLALYMILTAVFLGKFTTDAQVTFFLQNMAIVGGLFYVSALGSGSWE